jgi:hypothetical protein
MMDHIEKFEIVDINKNNAKYEQNEILMRAFDNSLRSEIGRTNLNLKNFFLDNYRYNI